MDRFIKFIRFPSNSRKPADASDEDLITEIQQENPDAWAIFLDRYTHVIYRKACEYSQTSRQIGTEDFEDEVADLYLFMAGYLKNSLKSFQGKCHPKTWVQSIVGNRIRIIKAYLLHKAPERADVRLPRVLSSRSQKDQDIFKRLVWGFDLAYIAQDLQVPETQCQEVEDLLAEKSPRVYDRIRANRASRSPHLSIQPPIDDEDTGLDIPSPDRDPEQTLEAHESSHHIQKAIFEGIETLSTPERRVLILLYNQDMKPAEIITLAASDPHLGFPKETTQNRIYYLKDRALDKIGDHIIHQLTQETGRPPPDKSKRALLESIETYFLECGFPTDRTAVPD